MLILEYGTTALAVSYSVEELVNFNFLTRAAVWEKVSFGMLKSQDEKYTIREILVMK